MKSTIELAREADIDLEYEVAEISLGRLEKLTVRPIPKGVTLQAIERFRALCEAEKSAELSDALALLAVSKREIERLESMAHRLALDLECLLLSTDNPAATKWWEEAHQTLEAWRAFNRRSA